MDLASSIACDDIEPDNIDGYENDSGFPLTATDAVNFDNFLVSAAHARNMTIGQESCSDLASQFAEVFDWALVEECYQIGECAFYQPFSDRGKALLLAEYVSLQSAWCVGAKSRAFSLAQFPLNLEGLRNYCP